MTPRAMITGATGAIGQAIARRLLERGYAVWVTARERNKGERLLRTLSEKVPGGEVHLELCDLSRQQEIARMSERFSGALDVLVNAAAETPRRRQETEDGIELQFATNVLAYYWMVRGFRTALAQAPHGNVVNVASYWAGGLDLDDVEFKRRRYDNDAAYRQSKQADRMLARGLAPGLAADGIRINSCHPGDVRSQLSRDLGFGGHQTPDEAAATPVALAVSELGGDATGEYFAHGRHDHCSFCDDAAGVARLLEVCSRY